MAGVESVYYVDFDNVISFMPTSDGVTVGLLSGKSWCKIEADEVRTSAAGSNAVSWIHRVEILYHGDATEVMRDFMEMKARRFLVKVVDNKGIPWVYGSGVLPLRFNFSYTNEGEADSETAFRLEFTAECWHPMLQMY